MQTPLQQAIILIGKRQRQLKNDLETSAMNYIQTVSVSKQITAIDDDLATLRGLLEVEQEVIEKSYSKGCKDGRSTSSKYLNGQHYYTKNFNQQ